MQSNDIALIYAEKAYREDADPRFQMYITMASASLANDKLRGGDMAGAFNYLNMAITNYESLSDPETNLFSKAIAGNLYREGGFVASILGKTNETINWAAKVSNP